MNRTWKLTIQQQMDLRDKYVNGESVKSLSAEYGITESSIYKALRRYETVMRNANGEVLDSVSDEIVKMHSIGASISSITKKTGVRWQSIYRVLKNRNVEIKFKTKIPTEEESEICKMYLSGMSVKDIKDKTRRSRDTIAVVLMRNGISIRPRSEATRMAIKTGTDSPSWTGGRSIRYDGYVIVYSKEHPCSNRGGYVLEHRMVMSDFMGRPLKNSEIVHHINGIRSDNRIENLMILDRNHHHGEVECPFCNKKFLIK